MMKSVVIFADPRDIAVRVLLPSLLHEINKKSDLYCQVLLLTDDVTEYTGLLRYWLNRLLRKLQLILGSGHFERALYLRPLNLKILQQSYDLQVRVMPGGNPNHEDILKLVNGKKKAELAINIYTKKLFQKPLLDNFEMVVNYHNGSLPGFRGIRASNWSIYQSVKTSGYSFHRMAEKFDTGNILLSNEVELIATETVADLELRKAQHACSYLPQLLDAMIKQDAGEKQEAIGCEHNVQAHKMMTQVVDPSALSKQEWERRLSAFLRINTFICGKWWSVTGVRQCTVPGKLGFYTSDGCCLHVTAIDFWPAWFKMGLRGM